MRQLLAHQAGLFAFDEQVDRSLVADLDRLAVVLARQKPAWEPGTRQAYHAITLGYYEGELLRRIDPQHRSLGQFFQDEIATPLGLDFYIRLPESIPNSRLATLARPSLLAMLRGFGIALYARGIESSLEHLAGARGFDVSSRRAAHLCPQFRSAVRRRRRHGARHRPCLQRVRDRRTGAGVAPGDAATCWRHRRFRRPAASTTSA